MTSAALGFPVDAADIPGKRSTVQLHSSSDHEAALQLTTIPRTIIEMTPSEQPFLDHYKLIVQTFISEFSLIFNLQLFPKSN